MLTVAYLANQFPAAVEPYVGEEIQKLRQRGVRVISGSVRRPEGLPRVPSNATGRLESVCLEPVRLLTLLRALSLLVKRWNQTSRLMTRVLLQGKESPQLRLKALLHTWLGAYYALLLQEERVDHIHVHHGYFGSWIGMAAAQMLGTSFSMTLHGSDLLVHGAYLNTKLSHCRFCITISEYNRRYILQRFPQIDPKTIIVSRLGVDTTANFAAEVAGTKRRRFTLLTAGRLHAVKNHAFLVGACARLRDLGVDFECAIAGKGPERPRLQSLIRESGLQDRITLLGQVPQHEMDSLYRNADLFVLTSHSEGIPVVLMEAMARGTIVLAPAITGIPELVVPRESGFLYDAGNLEDFVNNVLSVQAMINKDGPAEGLNRIRHAARLRILRDFNRQENLAHFAETFLQSIALKDWSSPHENPVLQQI